MDVQLGLEYFQIEIGNVMDKLLVPRYATAAALQPILKVVLETMLINLQLSVVVGRNG